MSTVTLVVGKTKAAFQVHEADLFEASTFFRSAFTSDSQESTDRTMALPEDDESTFNLLVEWFYRQRYDVPPKANENGNDRFMQPFQLYVLAIKYGIPSLRNLIVSQVFTAFKQDLDPPTCESMVYAYKNTSRDSTLRRVIAARLASICSNNSNWPRTEFIQNWLRDHGDITTDVLISLAKHARVYCGPFDGKMPEDFKEQEPGNGKGK